jgi:hypothetical protein
MALPSSGQIAFSQLAAELGNSCSNISLRDYSACANLTSPDGISELYGKSCIPIYGTGTWAGGGSLITARWGSGGAGTQNVGLAFGGANTSSENSKCTCTEEYNGTSWSAGGALITARTALGGAGTQNEAIALGGGGYYVNVCACTEEYNGTSWSAGGAMITARHALAGAGTQNESLAVGGTSIWDMSESTTASACTEEYNGTSWSTGGALINCRTAIAAAGTQNVGLAMGGYGSSGTISCTEEYNGTSWSAGGALITARNGVSGAGTQNAGLAMGGGSFGARPVYGCVCLMTEEYNGISWSTANGMSLQKKYASSTGINSSALVIGGISSYTIYSCVEEYTKSETGKCLA